MGVGEKRGGGGGGTHIEREEVNSRMWQIYAVIIEASAFVPKGLCIKW